MAKKQVFQYLMQFISLIDMIKALQATTQLHDAAANFLCYALIIFAYLFYEILACNTLGMT